MVHISLEDHLEEVCPKCGKAHENQWHLQTDEHRLYFKMTCLDCNYILFKKIDFIVHDLEHMPN